MFVVLHNPKAAFNKVGSETGVDTADPHRLVLMLFEGAMLAVASASMHMQRKEGAGDTARKGEAISKAINIITNGLKASLDQEAGGELAGKLGALYDYMSARLLYANLHNQPAVLDEISHLLAELKGAWGQIGSKA